MVRSPSRVVRRTTRCRSTFKGPRLGLAGPRVAAARPGAGGAQSPAGVRPVHGGSGSTRRRPDWAAVYGTAPRSLVRHLIARPTQRALPELPVARPPPMSSWSATPHPPTSVLSRRFVAQCWERRADHKPRRTSIAGICERGATHGGGIPRLGIRCECPTRDTRTLR